MKNHLLAALLLCVTVTLVGAPMMVGTADAAPPTNKKTDKKADKKADKKVVVDELDEDRSPGTLYKEFCSNCHDPGIAGAPKTGEKAAWEALLKSRGFDALVLNTIKGAGMMPVKGACVACSDKEIEEVVKFMLDKAKVPYQKKK